MADVCHTQHVGNIESAGFEDLLIVSAVHVTIAVDDVTTQDHGFGDNSVEAAALEVKRLIIVALLVTNAKVAKVFSSVRTHIVVQLELNSPNSLTPDFNIKETVSNILELSKSEQKEKES